MKQRIVVKIGSSSLTSQSGGLDLNKLSLHVSSLAHLQKLGHQVILVTSAAIASGYKKMGLAQRPVRIEEKQAAAAVGQSLLMEAYNREFTKFDVIVGQVLLTRGDFSRRESYNNALNTLNTLLEHGIIPVINENDTVAVGEIKFGDNDILAALVACLLKADMLIIVTDIDGYYERDPRKHKEAQRISTIQKITPEIIANAKNSSTAVGTGGMLTKIKAAEQALTNGTRVFIGQSTNFDSLEKIVNGSGAGTYFGENSSESLQSKKQWIAFHAEVKGTIRIDGGAVNALIEDGRSLLPVGVREIDGEFDAGQVVAVTSLEGKLIGKGIINYSAGQLSACKGKALKELKLESAGKKPEVIHRDDWVELYCDDVI